MSLNQFSPALSSFHTAMGDMIAVYIKTKARRAGGNRDIRGSRWSKETDDMGSWMLNRPALCCTWSWSSCERGRVESALQAPS